MSARIVEIAGGAVSLEFEPEDSSAVAKMLRDLKAKQKDLHETHETFVVNGELITYMDDEEDHPRLVSQSSKGSEILRGIAAELKKASKPSGS